METDKVIPGIEASEHATSFTGEVAVNFFRLKAMRSALALELRTGMRFSSRYSVAQKAREATGCKSRRKEAVLVALDEHIEKYIQEHGVPRKVVEA